MKVFINNRGFTMIEVLIAMTILSIGVLGLAGLAGTALRSSQYSQSLTQGINLAQDRIEALQSVDYDNIETTDLTTARTDLRRTCTGTAPDFTCIPLVSTFGNMPSYTWNYTVKYMDLDNNGTADPDVDRLKRVTVTVYWIDNLWQIQKSTTVTSLRSES